jgi:hypothetical protein
MNRNGLIAAAATLALAAVVVVSSTSKAPPPRPPDPFFSAPVIRDAGPTLPRQSPCFRELAGSKECAPFLKAFGKAP